MKQTKHKVVKEFNYGKRKCVIISIEWDFPKQIKSIPKIRYNGYIEVRDYEQNVEIKTEEITYKGNLDFSYKGKGLNASDGKSYIGFETQTAESVERKCMMIVDELWSNSLWFRLKGWIIKRFK